MISASSFPRRRESTKLIVREAEQLLCFVRCVELLTDWIPVCTKSRQSTIQQAGRGVDTAGMTGLVK